VVLLFGADAVEVDSVVSSSSEATKLAFFNPASAEGRRVTRTLTPYPLPLIPNPEP